MIGTRVAVGIAISALLATVVAAPVHAETLTRGNYFCVKYKHRPGYYKTTFITEVISDAVGGTAAAAAAGATKSAGAATAAGSTARYVVKKVLEWVPPSTTCLKWEHGSRMDGSQYQH